MLRDRHFRKSFVNEILSEKIQRLKTKLFDQKLHESRVRRKVKKSYKNYRQYYPYFPIKLNRINLLIEK